jgi:hypothetical protein
MDATKEELASLRARRRRLADHFRALLHQLMTAQIRIHYPDVKGILA